MLLIAKRIPTSVIDQLITKELTRTCVLVCINSFEVSPKLNHKLNYLHSIFHLTESIWTTKKKIHGIKITSGMLHKIPQTRNNLDPI